MQGWLENSNIKKDLLYFTYPKGKRIYINQELCEGIIYLLSGEIRVFTTSDNCKEITLFTLVPQETCILSASCVLPSFELDITLIVQKDCQIALLPSKKTQKLAQENLAFSQKINEIVNKRLSQTLQVLNNIAFTPLQQRIKNFFLQAHQKELYITHEELANHIGSAREVVSRALKEMEQKGEILLQRGKIIINQINPTT